MIWKGGWRSVPLNIRREVEERRQAEDALRLSEKRLRRAEVVAGLGNWEFIMGCDQVKASEGARIIYGLGESEWSIAKIQKLPLPEHRSMLDEALNGLIEEGKPYNVEFKIRRPTDGKIIDIHSIAEYSPERGVVFGVIQDITEGKQAEEALRKTTETLQTLIQASPAAIVALDPEGNVKIWNPAAECLFGWREIEVLEQFLPYVSEDNQEEHYALRERVLRGDGFTGVEVRRRKKDGTPVDISVSTAPMRDVESHITGIMSVNIDITERKKAEKALQQSEREKAILNQIANVFLTIPDEKIYEEVLVVILKALRCRYGIFGYIGDSGDLIIPSMTREIWSECQVQGKSIVFPRHLWGNSLWGKAIREKKSFSSEGPFQTPEGHVPVHNFLTVPIVFMDKTIGLASVANKDGGFTEEDKTVLERIACNISPILNTRLQRDKQELERKRAEEALRESEERLKMAMDLAKLVQWEYDVETGMFSFDEQFYALYGTTSRHEGGPLMSAVDYACKFIPPEESHIVAEETAKASTTTDPNFTHQLEHRIIRADGEERHIIVRYGVVCDQTGRVVKHRGANQDITERKRAEDALRESEERFSAFFRASPIGTSILLLTDSQFADVNDAFLGLLGYMREEVIGQNPLELGIWVEPEDRVRVVEILQREGSLQDFETQFHRKSGEIMDVLFSAEVIEAAGQQYLLGLTHDITERRLMEKAVAEAEAKYRGIFENALMGIFQSTPQGSCLSLNMALARMLGYDSPEDALNTVSDIARQLYVNPGRRSEMLRLIEERGHGSGL